MNPFHSYMPDEITVAWEPTDNQIVSLQRLFNEQKAFRMEDVDVGVPWLTGWFFVTEITNEVGGNWHRIHAKFHPVSAPANQPEKINVSNTIDWSLT